MIFFSNTWNFVMIVNNLSLISDRLTRRITALTVKLQGLRTVVDLWMVTSNEDGLMGEPMTTKSE